MMSFPFNEMYNDGEEMKQLFIIMMQLQSFSNSLLEDQQAQQQDPQSTRISIETLPDCLLFPVLEHICLNTIMDDLDTFQNLIDLKSFVQHRLKFICSNFDGKRGVWHAFDAIVRDLINVYDFINDIADDDNDYSNKYIEYVYFRIINECQFYHRYSINVF